MSDQHNTPQDDTHAKIALIVSGRRPDDVEPFLVTPAMDRFGMSINTISTKEMEAAIDTDELVPEQIETYELVKDSDATVILNYQGASPRGLIEHLEWILDALKNQTPIIGNVEDDPTDG